MIALLVTLCLWKAAESLAQAEDTEQANPQSFQVELIVFRYLAPDNSGEIFSENPIDRYYPEKLHHLSASRSERATQREAELATEMRPPALLAAPEPAEDPANYDPPAFERLDPELHALSAAVASIRRSQAYHLLYHQAWRQTIPHRTDPDHILITGGKQFDQHYELEGFISLSRGRYLHLETRLWLNEFVPREEWSNASLSLPPVPEPPPVPIEQPVTDALDNDDADDVVVVTLGADGTPSFGDPGLIPDTRSAPAVLSPDQTSSYQLAMSWLLHQRTRLRSGQLHYVDHPHFGVLIYINPVEVKETER